MEQIIPSTKLSIPVVSVDDTSITDCYYVVSDKDSELFVGKFIEVWNEDGDVVVSIMDLLGTVEDDIVTLRRMGLKDSYPGLLSAMQACFDKGWRIFRVNCLSDLMQLTTFAWKGTI